MIRENNKRFARRIVITGLLATTGVAHAMSTVTSPIDWRFTSSTTFNGASFDGVARIAFDTDGNLNNGAYICSGTLLSGGQYVLTAAHCADNFNVMKVQFGVNGNVATVTTGVSAAYVNSNWVNANISLQTGSDIAILKLDQIISGITGFNLYGSNAIGQTVLQMGYGTTNTGSSTVPSNWNDWGWGHYGYNTYDVGIAQLKNYSAGYGQYGFEYVADFDDGSQQHNALDPSYWGYGTWSSNTGVAGEALTSGGDSGGGDFVWSGSEWLLAGVHSWGMWFCDGYVDANCANRSGYGDTSGSSAVFSHINWINSVTSYSVPEPDTLPLLAAGLFTTFGLGRWRKRS